MWKLIKSNPLAVGAVATVLIAAILIFFLFLDKGRQRHENVLVNKGELTERSRANEEVVNSIERAKAASEHPTDEQLNRVCSKYDRNC